MKVGYYFSKERFCLLLTNIFVIDLHNEKDFFFFYQNKGSKWTACSISCKSSPQINASYFLPTHGNIYLYK